MVIMTIPKNLLTHTVTLSGITTDQWQSKVATLKAVLTRVRIEPTQTLIRSKDGQELQLTAILYVDAQISKPQDVTFALGDRVEAFGTIWHIESIKPFTAFGSLHHWELGLA